jgi:uncharacterized protein YhdP
MPDAELQELLFNPQPQEEKEAVKINVMEILKGLYEYNVTADADINLKTAKDNIDGVVNLTNISIIDLPKSNANLSFKNNTINIDSKIFTAKNEVSTLKGSITTGKKPYADLNVKSDLDISNALNIVKKVALIFNIKDLQTLSASGTANMDFNIKTDMQTVKSSGFLKVPTARLYYGAYKIGLDNINADISLAENNVNIKNISLKVLGQPLRIYGTYSSDAVADIHAIADKLSVKGLLIAL